MSSPTPRGKQQQQLFQQRKQRDVCLPIDAPWAGCYAPHSGSHHGHRGLDADRLAHPEALHLWQQHSKVMPGPFQIKCIRQQGSVRRRAPPWQDSTVFESRSAPYGNQHMQRLPRDLPPQPDICSLVLPQGCRRLHCHRIRLLGSWWLTRRSRAPTPTNLDTAHRHGLAVRTRALPSSGVGRGAQRLRRRRDNQATA